MSITWHLRSSSPSSNTAKSPPGPPPITTTSVEISFAHLTSRSTGRRLDPRCHPGEGRDPFHQPRTCETMDPGFRRDDTGGWALRLMRSRSLSPAAGTAACPPAPARRRPAGSRDRPSPASPFSSAFRVGSCLTTNAVMPQRRISGIWSCEHIAHRAQLARDTRSARSAAARVE